MGVQDIKEDTNSADDYKASAEYIEKLTINCDEIQKQVLTNILTQNAETEYLKRHRMVHGTVDRETFKRNVPLVTYKDVKPDIMRIYNGDFSPILCAQPFSELWLSSGTSEGQGKLLPATYIVLTSGQHRLTILTEDGNSVRNPSGTSEGQGKLLPATYDEMVRRDLLLTAIMPFVQQRIDGTKPNKGKALSLLITREEIVTPGGLIARPGLNSVFKNPQFYRDNPYPYNTNTSPIEAIYCPDHFQSVYTQLLCGFYQRHDVTYVKAVFCSNLVWAINFLKRHYLDLCRDITSGCLSQKIVDPSLRAYMVKNFMKNPEPELGKFIENSCLGENWKGILQKIWPNTKYLESVVTGSMAQYIPMLNYYSGGLPLVSIKYSSSECDLGFNLNPMCDPYNVSYTIMPNMAYYEFLPLESSGDGFSEMVDLADVEVGKEYEIVVTTYCGLYRYRLGDVLSPTSFYNSTPQFKFVRKLNVLLSIDFAVTTEVELQNAINNASTILRLYDTKIVEYTSSPDVKTIPGHYVIYIELTTINQAKLATMPEILQQCCFTMEGSFGVQYRNGRVDESIGPLEIRVVKIGTFETVRDYAILNVGASFVQFKVPRCVKSLPMLELLNAGVISTHFSSSIPSSVHDWSST